MSLQLLRTILPKVPKLAISSALHLLSLNPPSKHWDFRTFITVATLRFFLDSEKYDRHGNVTTVEQTQQMTKNEQPLEDSCWVSKVEMPLGGSGTDEARILEEMLDRAIRELAAGEDMVVHRAEVGKEILTGEWTGWRDVKTRGPYNKVEKEQAGGNDEKLKYQQLIEDVSTWREPGGGDRVMLWIHGGAYFMCDPITHRPMGKLVSKAFGGPVFLPRYRLAPQSPFPAAIVDALLSYLYLLYPPPGSFHPAYSPDQIVFGGDSAGGGLILAFTQLLLWFQTPNDDGSRKTIRWQGEERELSLPKGLVVISPWIDLARCFVEIKDGKGGASENACADGDYIPVPALELKSKYRQSPAWPADPPRTHFYADDSSITHQLVSALTAKSWKGCPPVWICVGDECLRDSSYYLAHRLLQDQVPVQFEKYTAMPHAFPMLIQHHPCSPQSYRGMGQFLRHHVSPNSSQEYIHKIIKIHPKTLAVEELDESSLSLGGLTVEELIELMKGEVKRWPKWAREAEDKNEACSDDVQGAVGTAAEVARSRL